MIGKSRSGGNPDEGAINVWQRKTSSVMLLVDRAAGWQHGGPHAKACRKMGARSRTVNSVWCRCQPRAMGLDGFIGDCRFSAVAASGWSGPFARANGKGFCRFGMGFGFADA
jgi:hypothetical protein